MGLVNFQIQTKLHMVLEIFFICWKAHYNFKNSIVRSCLLIVLLVSFIGTINKDKKKILISLFGLSLEGLKSFHWFLWHLCTMPKKDYGIRILDISHR
jgi:hypothetical protein